MNEITAQFALLTARIARLEDELRIEHEQRELVLLRGLEQGFSITALAAIAGISRQRVGALRDAALRAQYNRAQQENEGDAPEAA